MLTLCVAAVVHEFGVRGVGDRRAVDAEGGDIDLVTRPLVVVREALLRRAHCETARRKLLSALGGPCVAGLPPRRRVHARVRQLQGLQHGLVVLMLVLQEHLPDERRNPVEHRQRPSAHPLHQGNGLNAAQVRELAPVGARRLEGVVDVGEVGAQQFEPGLPSDPEVLERGDVPEVPDERAHQRVVNAIEIVVGDVLDQGKRALARLFE